MSFSGYPEYKDSGVAWLGNLPEHWSILRGKNLFRNRRESARPEDEQLAATQKYGVLPQSRFMEAEQQRVTLALTGTENFRHVERGDFVISLRSFQGGVEHSKWNGCVSPAYTVMEPTSVVDNGYFRNLLKSERFISLLSVFSEGIRDGKTISYTEFASIEFPVPNLKEQRKIAEFLDHETARIDALIEEQKRLIELLKEKRQAVISHAVTKGLDPNVPMKDSGVAWLGEVPAHWVVGPLRWYATVQGGIAKGKSYESGMATVERPYLRVANVQDGYVDLSEIHHIEVAASEADSYALRSGDVLMNEGGDNDKLGRGTVWRGEIEGCLHQNHVFSIRPNEHLSPEWLSTFTRSNAARSYFYLYSKQSTNLASVSSSNVMSCPLPIPPRQEQEQILKQIDTKVRGINSLMEAAESMMNLLGERRSALISAAVTGKIDVRDWQPPEGYTYTEAEASEGASA